MQGDFSRLTFDSKKHYRSVLMQQGRVQLDADWNEQVGIFNHSHETLIRDLIGDAGAPAHQAGFAISIDGDEADEPDRTAVLHTHEEIPPPIFQISNGRYYVAGILCENEQARLFTQQPIAPHVSPKALKQFALVYLDVWSRHVTAAEDPTLREIALNGIDTTTRIQTVWQVKILPIHESEQRLHNDHGHISYEQILELPEWCELVSHFERHSAMRARHNLHTTLENQLYRVEIHSVQGDVVTFKWSRENASLLFALDEINESSSEGGSVQYSAMLSDQLRDKTQLRIGDWVEFVTSDPSQDGHTLPLYRVTDLPNFTSQQVTLTGPRSTRLEEPIKQQGRSLLLRRWDHDARRENTSKDGTIPLRENVWLDLELGIQVNFTPGGTYAVGDYWLIPARTLAGGIEWPTNDQGPLALPPRGQSHHHCPLALLHFHHHKWSVVRDLRRLFSPLPLVTQRTEELSELEQRPVSKLVEICTSQEELAHGELVAVEPATHRSITRASAKNARLLLGVVSEREHHAGHVRYHITTHGRARCRVVGQVEWGDLLAVSHHHPGCARALPAEQIVSHHGAILGKALEAYVPDDDDDSSFIDVFVTL